MRRRITEGMEEECERGGRREKMTRMEEKRKKKKRGEKVWKNEESITSL